MSALRGEPSDRVVRGRSSSCRDSWLNSAVQSIRPNSRGLGTVIRLLAMNPAWNSSLLERPFRRSCIQILPDSGHRPVSMKALTQRYGGSIAAATSGGFEPRRIADLRVWGPGGGGSALRRAGRGSHRMFCAECNRAMTRNGDAYYGPHTPTHHVSLTVTYAIPGSAGRLQMVTTPSADWLVDGRPCSQAWRQCSTFVMFFHPSFFRSPTLTSAHKGSTVESPPYCP